LTDYSSGLNRELAALRRDLEEERRKNKDLERLVAALRLDVKDAELKSGSKDKTLQALERELCTIKQTLARVLQENSDLKRREAEARNRQIELEGLANQEILLREQVNL
jgi:chromosome segregation ATPase